MRIIVDRKLCTLHGQCTLVAPDLFQFAESGELEFTESPAEDRRQAAEDAMDSCPEQAIAIDG